MIGYVAVSDLTRLHHVRDGQAAGVRAEADLRSLARARGPAGVARTCAPFYVPGFELTSLVAYDFDRPSQTILRAQARVTHGLVLVPTTPAAGRYFGVTPARLVILRRETRNGFRMLASDTSWRLYARGCQAPPPTPAH